MGQQNLADLGGLSGEAGLQNALDTRASDSEKAADLWLWLIFLDGKILTAGMVHPGDGTEVTFVEVLAAKHDAGNIACWHLNAPVNSRPRQSILASFMRVRGSFSSTLAIRSSASVSRL